MTYPNDTVSFVVDASWLAIAQKFAAEQARPEQQTRIFQQTIAILGLQQYLEYGEVQTALTESYSWHPQTRTLTAWADLLLPNYGRIFCVFGNNDGLVLLPPILPANTFGFVVFKLAPDCSTLELMGFLPQRHLTENQQQFAVDELQAIATLFDELYLLSEEKILIETEIQSISLFDDVLEEHFATLLRPDNIQEIIHRLNRSLNNNQLELQDILVGDNEPEDEPETEDISELDEELDFPEIAGVEADIDEYPVVSYAASEAKNNDYCYGLLDKDDYVDNQEQKEIMRATARLTQILLIKTRELHQELDLL